MKISNQFFFIPHLAFFDACATLVIRNISTMIYNVYISMLV